MTGAFQASSFYLCASRRDNSTKDGAERPVKGRSGGIILRNKKLYITLQVRMKNVLSKIWIPAVFIGMAAVQSYGIDVGRTAAYSGMFPLTDTIPSATDTILKDSAEATFGTDSIIASAEDSLMTADSIAAAVKLAQADSIARADSIASAQKALTMTEKELRKEKAREERKAAREKRIKEKEARWERLDKRDADRAADKQARKDARIREKKRRLLMREIEQRRKDAEVLQKYIERLEARQARKDARKNR